MGFVSPNSRAAIIYRLYTTRRRRLCFVKEQALACTLGDNHILNQRASSVNTYCSWTRINSSVSGRIVRILKTPNLNRRILSNVNAFHGNVFASTSESSRPLWYLGYAASWILANIIRYRILLANIIAVCIIVRSFERSRSVVFDIKSITARRYLCFGFNLL